MATRQRNYREEYDEYHGTAKQKARRASRGRARYELEKAGRVRKGDGKEVDHKNLNPMDNRRSNLKVVNKTTNRKKQPATKGRKT